MHPHGDFKDGSAGDMSILQATSPALTASVTSGSTHHVSKQHQGRAAEIFGPETLGKTTLALQAEA